MVGTLTQTNASTVNAVALYVPSASQQPQTGLKVSWATIQALSTNGGQIKILAPTATSPVGYTIVNPGDSLVLWSPASLHLGIDLAEVFILPTVGGEGVSVIYVK
jgi:hypothetical protein